MELGEKKERFEFSRGKKNEIVKKYEGNSCTMYICKESCTMYTTVWYKWSVWKIQKF